MSVMTRSQISAAKARGARMREQAGAKSMRIRKQASARGVSLRQQAGVNSARAREQAGRMAARVTPVAAGVSVTARRRLRDARAWAAPRMEQAGHSVEKDIGPKVADMLVSAAHRVEPAPRKRSVRWRMIAAGVATLAGGGAAAIVLGRKAMSAGQNGQHAEPATPVPASTPASEDSEARSSARSQPS